MLQVTKLRTALASMAIAGLPMLGNAQGTAPQRPSPPREASQQKPATDQNSPQHHLREAKRVLNSIDASALKGESKTQVVELRSHFTQLESAWQAKAAASARPGATATGHAGGHTGTTTAGTGGTTSGTPAAAAAGTTGTPEQAGATGAASRQAPRTGTATGDVGNWMTHYQAIDSLLDRLLGDTKSGVSASPEVNLDANTKAPLVEFRRHIDQFHTIAMTQSRVGEEDAASAAAHSGVTGAMTQTRPATGEPTSATPAAAASAGAQANVDSAAIARLSAQIDDLIGSASSSSTSGTAGAVGTSGTAAITGTVCVDRAKLEQLKRDIQALQSGR